MEWQQQKPDQEGWWWSRKLPTHDGLCTYEAEVVQVQDNGAGSLYVFEVGRDGGGQLTHFENYEWCGPLETP